MKHGLTLVGTMMAVALSGVVALLASKMSTNQLALAKMEELMDRRQAILKFYSDLLKNETIIKCTIEKNPSLKQYIKQYHTSSGITAAKLVPPASPCSSTDSLIPTSGMYLGESISIPRTDGWWKLDFSWEGKGKGTIDFIVELCLDRTKYDTRYPTVKIQQLQWQCPNKKTVRVRYSENSIAGGSRNCAPKAVVDIALHTANRQVTCSTHPLVQIRDCPDSIHKIDPSGNIVCSSRCEWPPGGVGVSINKGISALDCPQPAETAGDLLELNEYCEEGDEVVKGITAPKVNCELNEGYKGLRGVDASCPSPGNCYCPGGGDPCRCSRDPTTELCNVGGCPGGTTC